MRSSAGVAVYDPEGPSLDREDQDTMVDRRTQTADVTQMSVPLLIAIAFVVSAVTATISAGGMILAFQQTDSELRADVRVILTRMESQAELSKANQATQDVQTTTMMEAVKELKGQVKLLELQYAQMAKELVTGRNR